MNFIDSNKWAEKINSNSLDLIIAANVLEHVSDVKELLMVFMDKLKDDGIIIISGPTENRLYKLGRWIINFEGDFRVFCCTECSNMKPKRICYVN